ncbi:hypothetical protein FI667_g2322, partial [Globisporangium splendens]
MVARQNPHAPAARGSDTALRHFLPADQLLFSSLHSTPSGIREDRKTNVGQLVHFSTRPWSPVGPRSISLGAPLPAALARTPLGGIQTEQLTRFPSSMQVCLYSSRRNPWQSNSDWVATAKTGALVLLGAGALVASTSLAFGLIIAGAAGYGVYSLYQKILGLYRSDPSRDPFGRVNADIDALNELFGRQKQQRRPAGETGLGQRELDSLVQGLPLVVRGLVKTIFSFVGKAMQGSMQRAGELRRLTNEHLQSHPRIVSELGSGVSVSTPQQWMESSEESAPNGLFVIAMQLTPLHASIVAQRAQVTVKASVGVGGGVNLKEAKYRNHQTGEVIDLLRDGGSAGGPRKTVIDAEYVDIDDRNSGRSSRW